MTIEVLEEVRNVVADYLTARKVYPTYEQAIEAVVAYPNEVMDYIAELECMGEPYAQAMGAAYAVVMA